MLPEIYDVIFPPNQYYIYLFSPKEFQSRLINDAAYQYQMKLVQLEEVHDELDVILHAQLSNSDFIEDNFLAKIYSSTSDFTMTDYSFTIEISYKLQKSTGRIIKGGLILNEQLHDNLRYTINMHIS